MSRVGLIAAVASTLLFVVLAVPYLVLSGMLALQGIQPGSTSVSVWVVYAVALFVLGVFWVRVIRRRPRNP